MGPGHQNQHHLIMKLKSLLVGIACSIAAPVVFAQTETITTTTTTTTGAGTITEYSPGSAFVVTESSGPVTYRYGDRVVYITRSGKELSDDEVQTRIKVGTPVNVHFSRQGEDRVIKRVEIEDEDDD
jgi:hypothetical protein